MMGPQSPLVSDRSIGDSESTSRIKGSGDVTEAARGVPDVQAPGEASSRTSDSYTLHSRSEGVVGEGTQPVLDGVTGQPVIVQSPSRTRSSSAHEDGAYNHQEPSSSTPRHTLSSAPSRSSTHSAPYSAFSYRMKWFITSLVGVAGVFSPISSNIFVPAIPAISTAFDRPEQDITLAITVYLVFQAITPSFLGSLSDSYGRRPVAIATLGLYIVANVGLALVPSTHGGYAGLLVLRALQATGGSCLIAIGAGCVSDVGEPRERGMYMAVFQVGAMLGPAFGPLIGGALAQTLGWRSIFWFLVIACGVVLVPLIFFLPETLRSLVGDGSIPPPRLNSSPQQLWAHHKARIERERTGTEKVHVERPERMKYEPFSAFLILLNPEILLVFIFSSVVYLEFYSVLAVYSTALKDAYGLDELQIGLCYLPCGIGIIVSAIINGRLIDLYYRREEVRVGGDFRRRPDTFRLERVRFIVSIPFLILFAAGCLALGWCLHFRTHLAAVLAVNFLVGIGSGTTNLATVYGQDLMPGKGGAVSASLNLVRCMFGAVGTGVIQLLYTAINPGWTFVLLTALCVVALPLPLVVLRYGSRWRRRRRMKEEAKARKRESGVELGEGVGDAGGSGVDRGVGGRAGVKDRDGPADLEADGVLVGDAGESRGNASPLLRGVLRV